jgi:cardiolipin synthase
MTWLPLALHILLVVGFGLRILLRHDMRPDVRMGWLTVIVLLPYASCVLYYLFGEVALRRHGRNRYLKVQEFALAHGVRTQSAEPGSATARGVLPQWQAAFGYAQSINHFSALPGHQAELMADGADARARMLQDMEQARHEIHVLYYIWLTDVTGAAVARALARAARRGVVCRAMVDGVGSRALVHSPLWREMAEAGVQVAVALPVSHPLRVMLTSRLDLRNHRKITLIDGRITYCGSQNCADEAFAPKARYAPWVDIMLRLQGPVVAQMQLVFASDWNQASGRATAPRTPVVPEPLDPAFASGQGPGFVALAIAEGPSERRRSTPQLVSTLLASARREVVISTPYFIPDATVLEALCAAAWRGVHVVLIVPARNDSWIVGAASRSTYRHLLKAGVALHEFGPGLLHAKTFCVDGQVVLLGSTNLDLRSFDLNFENNVLLQDEALARAVRQRQQDYMARSRPVTQEQVLAWPWHRRAWNNLLAMLSPVL